MSGALSRGRSNDFGVSVRYTPCAKSEPEKEEEEEEGGKNTEEDEEEEEEEEEKEEVITILPRYTNSPRQARTHFPSGGRGKASGVTGARFRLRAASESLEDDDIVLEEEEGGEEEEEGEEGRRRGVVVGWPSPQLAPLGSEDLELTHCPHLPRQDSAAGSGVGGGSSDGREYRVDTASGGYASPVPGPSSTQTPTANGPRHLPGLDLFSQGADRTRLIGERLSSTDKISLSSPIYPNKPVEHADRSSSRQSLLEIVSTKLDRVKNRKRFSLAQGSLLKKPRLSEANVNVITSRVTRRQRRKEIEEKFGKRKSLRGDHHGRIETATSTSSDHDGCNWTFVFDPSGRLCYWWSSVVSVAFLYNFWVIIYRFAFQEINSDNIAVWFTLDYTADLLYVLDIAFHFRTGYLEDGVLQTDPAKLRIHYTNTTTFYIDCLCLLPLDFLYLSIGYCSIVRGFRLVKVYRFWSFQDRTERHTNYPNIIRSTTLIHYLFALFHWNACLYYIVARNRSDGAWRFPKEQEHSVALQYLHALHWSLITLTTIGPPPTPRTVGEYLFVIFELIFALVLFATFLGHIANIVTNVSAARKEFQARLDGVKTYMNLRRVPLKLQDRVIKWFDYLWMCNKSSDEEKALSLLPDKLKAEIAIHVHLDTLKRVEIFQNTEAGFLCELVLRLVPVLFSPGDYICRNGEVGKEMYIVNRGRLHVVADNGKTVLATLKPGSYFGEISILNMGTAGNRRTASVRSVGYSDLFCLAKTDLWDVLKEYPAARVKLEAIAVKRLAKYKKQPLEKVLERSRSTPGLVESTGQVPLDAMTVHRYHTLPSSLLSGAGPRPSMDRGEQADAERRRKLESTQSEDNLLSRCVEQRRLSTDSQPEVTYTLTTSTLTSCTDTPPLRSPTGPAPPPDLPKSPFTPPPSPRRAPLPPPPSYSSTASSASVVPPVQQQQQGGYTSYAVSSGTGASTLVADPLTGTPLHQATPMTYPTYPAQGSFPPYGSGGQQGQVTPLPFLTPYSAPLTYPPSPSTGLRVTQSMTPAGGAGGPLSSNQLASSQTNLFTATPTQLPFAHPHPHPPGSLVQTPTATLQPPPPPHSLSPLPGGSPSRGDNQTDILLKEISRLRERLAQLEGENTALTVKLTQQQWDVETRLNELEMHLGQSDSIASTDLSDERAGTGPPPLGSGPGDRTGGEGRGAPPSSLSSVVNKESII